MDISDLLARKTSNFERVDRKLEMKFSTCDSDMLGVLTDQNLQLF